MRIAFLSQLLPFPLDAGPKVRAYYVLRYLAEAGHEVTLVCFVRPTDRESDVRELRTLCRSVETVPLRRSRTKDVRDGLRSLVSAVPFLILRDHSAAMSGRLEHLAMARSFDAIHADQLWMAPYATAKLTAGFRVLDQHNAVFRVPQHLAAHESNPVLKGVLRREARRMASFERASVERFDRVVWVSQKDRQALGAEGGPAGTGAVIPIAVDPAARVPVERPGPFRVTFLGGLHWPPNAEGIRWFTEHAWPKVARAVPECVFTVIGKGSAWPHHPAGQTARMEVTGYVYNLERYLAETAVFVVPLLTGAGMRVKILDAWCWGLPVVTTSVGAEGIDAVHGENVLVADEPAAFADCLVEVLKDRLRASKLGRNGRATVEASYDWRKVYRAWDSVYS